MSRSVAEGLPSKHAIPAAKTPAAATYSRLLPGGAQDSGRADHPRAAAKSRQAAASVVGNQGVLGTVMRRRLEAIIPIVLLAILVQLIAPIAAFRAVAYAATDPLHMASICSEMAASADEAQTAPAGTPHDHGGCCAFCAVGHGGGVALEPPSLVSASLQRQYQLVSWLQAEDPVSAARVGSNAQARAPPAIS